MVYFLVSIYNTTSLTCGSKGCSLMNNDISSLAHSKWNYKSHIVFALKYRRQAINGKVKACIGAILRKLCEQKNVGII